MRRGEKNRTSQREGIAALQGTIMVFLLFSIVSDNFFTVYNISNVLKNSAVLFLVSIGITMAIVIGCNDISAGSVMSVSGIITALLLKNGFGLWTAIAAGLGTGILAGVLNGILIVWFQANFWVATFATYSIAQGAALVMSNGNGIAGFPGAFRFLGTGRLAGISVIVYLTFFLGAGAWFLMKKTRFGEHIYAVGGSEEIARLCGLSVEKIKFGVFVLSGTLAGAAGILLAAKTNVAMPSGGAGYEFDAIAAAMIGGTSLEGGKGTIQGTAVGVFLITILRNGLTVLGISSVFHYLLIGLIIMGVIILDVTRTRVQERKKGGRRG